MLQLDPTHRPSIADIMAHPWMKGEVSTKDQIVQEFDTRDQQVKAFMEAERKKKEQEKMNRVETWRRTMRGKPAQGGEEAKFDTGDEALFKPAKHLEQY